MMTTELPARTEGPHDEAIQVSFFSTGTVQIRLSMKSQPISNQWVIKRRLRSFLDRGWTDPLPIGVFLISHPNGPILFDTGESTHHNEPGFLPRWAPTSMLATTKISHDEGIVTQLRSRGIEPASLQAVVLSHLHGDHAGGLLELATAAPDVPIYTSKEHWDAVGKTRHFNANVQGFFPQHWPVGFKPRLLEPTENPVGPWKKSTKVTADGKVVAVDTPGHVPGHVSLVVYGDDGTTYFLPGDATYGVDLLDREEPDGINDDPQTAFKSLRMIKQFARETDVVVLPSHDPDVARLLQEKVVYKPTDSLS
ncbi:beta-lactamase-like protein [Staphylotrichum tortipilum]|uniref:Beta-lactamase-like protein n=1 Tax=Staphylotrichum tortipilum TaxID=2831512 RepID=A0AAN6MIV2_9PEZI|nr:beta-lactamase-like protein [Staphylotrichum longicolle]